MHKIKGVFFGLMGVLLSGLVQAAGVAPLGLEPGKSTRADFAVVARQWAPKTKPATISEGKGLTLDSAMIAGNAYSVRASFDGTGAPATLTELVLTAKAKPKTGVAPSAAYGVLKGFTASSSNARNLSKDDVEVELSTVDGHDVIRFHPPVSAWETIAVLGLFVVAVLLFLNGLRHQFMATVILTLVCFFMLGAIGPEAGWVIGPLWGISVWGLGSRPNRVYVSHGNIADSAPEGMVINPANGQVMIGGMGGMDTYGNSFGSNMNDPHM